MVLQKSVCFWILLLLIMYPLSGRAERERSVKEADRHDYGYLQVTGPCDFEFPRDHGAHPGYRIEWWYYTGHIHSESGKPYGFQLTFFRIQISPPDSDSEWPEKSSAWRTKQVFLAHAALSDLNRKRFYFDEQMARGALGLAGAVKQEDGIKVFVGSWSAVLTPEKHVLKAVTDNFSFTLQCRPLKPPVTHGNRGYSLKGSKNENASCYYSFTRLDVTGTLKCGDEAFRVDGSAWMDHEYSTAPLEDEITGWDWFSLQLSDETELMIYLLRLDRGGYHPASSGTFVNALGGARHLSKEDFKIEIVKKWKSPRTGATYPCRWRFRVMPFNMDLNISSDLPDQELITQKSTQVIYWEGSVSAKGIGSGNALEGKGYAEMTGYAASFDLLK
jgi:predicted secreted hydrolase